MCKYKDEKGNCNAPIPFKCGDECAIKPLLDTIAELRKDRDFYKRQMEFVIEQKEKLEKQLNITD